MSPNASNPRRGGDLGFGTSCCLRLSDNESRIAQKASRKQVKSRVILQQRTLRFALRQALDGASREIDTARSAHDDLTLARAIVLTARYLNDAHDLLVAVTGEGRLS
jgi:hypothetical protein